MDAARFAQLKSLFDAVCDLPEAERIAQLKMLGADPETVDAVLLLCSDVGGFTGRVAHPVIDALQANPGAALRSGDVLGAWTLLDEIGRGGMGRVFKARRSDGHFEQTAAIKLLAGVASPAALRYLARERQILASLTHPHVARLVDGGSTPQGQPYLVMEYIDGMPIDRYCQSRQLGRGQILQLFVQVCTAVAFAHRNLVVHCDLKPSNILVSDSGHAFLLDFGVSHLLGDAVVPSPVDAPASGAGNAPTQAAFTPRYASPEQRRGERVGTATDLYSLGVLLAELLGAQLHEGGTQPDALTEIRGLEHLPRDLAAVIALATHAAAQQRYPSVEALMHDLARYQSRQPVMARTRTTPYVVTMMLRRHWPWALVSLIFVATVSAFAWRMRSERNNALQAERAALAVKDYMVSVFQGVDPEVSGQRDLPISVLLDAGRDKLAADLYDQPAVRTEMLGILAGVYLNIGKRDQAIAMHQQAIALERGNARPRVLADLLHKQAYAIYDLEDFPRAEPIAREALALHEQLAPESIEHIESLRLLGTILLYQDRRDESLALLTRALQVAERVDGADSVEAARVHLDFARFHVYMDGFPQPAVAHARTARSVFAKHYGSDHYLYVNALEALSVALGYTGAFDEGLPLARETSEKRIELYGEVSNQAGFALYAYADMLGRAGRRLDAIPVLRRCIDIQARLDGSDTLAATVPLARLGRVLLEAGALDGAVRHLEQVIKVRMDLLDEADYPVTDARFFLGRALRLRGELALAEPLLAAALEAHRASPSAYQLVKAQLEMAALLRDQGKLDAAAAQIRAIDAAAFVDEPWRQGFLDLELARIAAQRGDIKGAITLSVQAEAQLSGGLGGDHPDLWLNRIDRAEWLIADAQPAAAKALAAEIAIKAAASIADDGYWAKRLAALKPK